MDSKPSLPILNAEEQRVLGALLEKCKTTPEYYPLTLNSLISACNQKSSRKPIVQYDEEAVIATLDSLKKKGLVSTATGGTSRATKYKHNLAIQFPLIPSELAVICLLLLRGPLTPGEINSNSGRLYEFETLDEVNQILEKLSDSDMPYIIQLPRRSGQKETRYMHLFGGSPDLSLIEETTDQDHKSDTALEERVKKLEEEVIILQEKLDTLMKEWTG